MSVIRGILYPLPRIFAKSLHGYFLLLQILACALTCLSVTSGFDWQYFEWTRDPTLVSLMFPAALIGFLVPVFLPFLLYIKGAAEKNDELKNSGIAIAQAALMGLLMSFIYKAFTGRAHPELFSGTTITDITHNFQFGFLRGGVFWGWPSSHTTVAFSVATGVIAIYRKNRLVVFAALLYALYVGIGVSMTIHWFSDFLAGAIFGTITGWLVGQNYLTSSSSHRR